MKRLVCITFLSLFTLSSFSQTSSDSAETDVSVKLTAFPFLFSNQELKGSIAIGPSLSLSGNRFELQIGFLYDLSRQEGRLYKHLPSSLEYYQYQDFYFLLFVNRYFRISNNIKIFPSLGFIPQGSIVTIKTSSTNLPPHREYTFIFLGVGLAYEFSDRIKLSVTINERGGESELTTGAFLELAYRFRKH